MSVCGLLRTIAETAVPERAIRVSVQADDALEIHADERLLVSAVSNLIQNAFKFTKNDGHILLRASRAGEHVVIEVEDECGGLPPGKDEELFEPYVRRGANKCGLGLGLAITREAIEKHGGRISVRNLPGKGCVFSVILGAAGA
jgi:signal transduction histidine kinase